jgi:hypothetical protein
VSTFDGFWSLGVAEPEPSPRLLDGLAMGVVRPPTMAKTHQKKKKKKKNYLPWGVVRPPRPVSHPSSSFFQFFLFKLLSFKKKKKKKKNLFFIL